MKNDFNTPLEAVKYLVQNPQGISEIGLTQDQGQILAALRASTLAERHIVGKSPYGEGHYSYKWYPTRGALSYAELITG